MFNTEKAKRNGAPPFMVKAMERANEKIEASRKCPAHEFDENEIRAAVRRSTVFDWQKAKVACKKCGIEFYALYAGGYRDALEAMKDKKGE